MKKYLYLFCGLLLALPALAQKTFYQRRLIQLVDMKEKGNAWLQAAPRVLMDAYRAGKIQGYFPNAPGAALSYNEMLEHFKLARRVGQGTNAFECCTNANPYRYSSANNPRQFIYDKPDPSLLDEFETGCEQVMEFVEDYRTDQERSAQRGRFLFVRIIWTDPQGVLPPENAVLFRYSDIEALDKQLPVPNPKNESQPLALRQVFEGRLFTSVIVRSSDQLQQNLLQAHKTKHGLVAFENSIWSY